MVKQKRNIVHLKGGGGSTLNGLGSLKCLFLLTPFPNKKRKVNYYTTKTKLF